jgi:hypothetical protein
MTRAVRRVTPFLIALLVLLAAPVHSSAQTTALYLDSQPGDYIGQGLVQNWTDVELIFNAIEESDPRRVSLVARTETFSTNWFLWFGVPEGSMQPGIYENAVRASAPTKVSPQLYVSGQSRGCNKTAGRFVVYEVEVDAAGAVTRFAADFEQHCDGTSAALFGAIRFNSTRASLVPFEGGYPVYSLTLEPPVNGYVTGPGIDCGAVRDDCDEFYDSETDVSLRAVPSVGFVFLGWAGDCVGKEETVVAVKWRRFCAPVFNRAPGNNGAESPDFSEGALFLDGAVGGIELNEPYTHPTWQVFAPLSAGSPIRSLVWVPSTQNASNRVEFQVDGPGGESFHILFASPAGMDLTPGTTYAYTSTTLDHSSPVPVLRIFRDGNSLSCTGGGRFTVHEFTLDEDSGSVSSFAADFELPCGSGEFVTGSLRYRSTRSSLLPLEGEYPLYALHIVPTIGGYVSATGVLCGEGFGTDCDEAFASPVAVSLEAVPSAGYQFVAWSGDCSGAAVTTMVVADRMRRCFAVFIPTPGGGAPDDQSLAAGTLLLDRLGAPPASARTIWLAADARISAWGGTSWLSATFTSASSGAAATLTFRVPDGSLVPGIYEHQYATSNHFSLSGCSVTGARFRIHELSVDPWGPVHTFAADFEAVCTSPSQRFAGAVRINSTRPTILPFDGAYPLAKLIIDPALNGIVSADGIDCGPGRGDCTKTFGLPATVTLQAKPLAGYRFVGWNGSCAGASITTVAVSWIHRCSAVFNAVIPGLGVEDPRLGDNAFMIESENGDPVGQGRRQVWLDATMLSIPTSQSRIRMEIRTAEGITWYMYLQAPGGEHLRAGFYDGAVSTFIATSSPGLLVSSPPNACTDTGWVGRFVIYEISFDSGISSEVTSLAADFEQRCRPGGPGLRGAIRFNSSRSILTPFAPSTFTPMPPPARLDFNRDGSPDLVWRHSVSGRNAMWFMNIVDSTVTLTTPSVIDTLSDVTWELRAVGDINADGSPDLIWQKRDTGRTAVWFYVGTTRIGTNYLYNAALDSYERDLDWKIVAAGDMDNDGHVDLVWRHMVSGELRIWHMNGNVQWDSVTVTTLDLNWQLAGLADINGDGMLDFVWRHAVTGKIAAWFMQDALFQVAARMTPSELTDPNWRIVGVADMNMDQKPDLVWQNFATGGLGIWYMNGVVMTHGSRMNPPSVSDPQWRIVGVK